MQRQYYVLRDDRQYFPPYEAAPVVRREMLERHPAAWEVLVALEGALNAVTMRELNHQVAVEGKDAAAVVRAWRESR